MQTYRIVVGVDGSDGSERALRWAVNEAHTRGGTVQAVMTYDWAGTEAALLAGLTAEDERQRAEDILAEAVSAIRREYRDVPIAAEVVLGNPAHKLAEAARDANILVVGSRGHGRLRQAVLGSVSEDCIRHAPCPVVVVPGPHPLPAAHTDLVDTGQGSEPKNRLA
jgi:nucleotide-binding universal stress UspA family protein